MDRRRDDLREARCKGEENFKGQIKEIEAFECKVIDKGGDFYKAMSIEGMGV